MSHSPDNRNEAEARGLNIERPTPVAELTTSDVVPSADFLRMLRQRSSTVSSQSGSHEGMKARDILRDLSRKLLGRSEGTPTPDVPQQLLELARLAPQALGVFLASEEARPYIQKASHAPQFDTSGRYGPPTAIQGGITLNPLRLKKEWQRPGKEFVDNGIYSVGFDAIGADREIGEPVDTQALLQTEFTGNWGLDDLSIGNRAHVVLAQNQASKAYEVLGTYGALADEARTASGSGPTSIQGALQARGYGNMAMLDFRSAGGHVFRHAAGIDPGRYREVDLTPSALQAAA